jgi:ribosomal protein S18 acetylase RimI-like enzyme
MMKRLLEIAEKADCEEVWLGTEVTNQAANALYRSLNPDDVSQVVGYTYKMDD